MLKNKFMFMGLIVLCSGCQLWNKTFKKKSAPTTSVSTAVKPTPPVPKGPKPYKEVITDKAKTSNGLFKVHFLDDRYFFEIPDSLLNKEFLLVSRISKSSTGKEGYGGDENNRSVINFKKGGTNKLFISELSYGIRSKDTTANGMNRAVEKSNMQPLVSSFDIKAINKDSIRRTESLVIDVTDYFGGDNLSKVSKKTLSATTIVADRSYIAGVKTFPKNIEVQTVKTYDGSDGNITCELNSSFVLLPTKPMRPRTADARVGYFSNDYVDFDENPQGVKNQSMITRWRLEPKPEDRARYLKGELVEPQTPIIFYIDPATPKKWIPYLIQGVNDWQVAFEQAGFKNAIMGKLAPNDSTWSLDDARHSAIVYKASSISNASGPHVYDPRTGEVLESHVNWYHNIMQVLHDWYFIQAGPLDPKARRMKFDDQLMGELIRFVSSHEIGHTLGLAHNFGSSRTVPVEKLRDKQWVETNGHTPSIMDYARFNYVAQPEDNIGPAGIFPRIGDYDKWAIEWGYRWWPEFKNKEEEETYSNRLIISRLNANKRLRFSSDEGTYFDGDPTNQTEDLGDDAVLASGYGIKNLKRIVPNLLEWTYVPNEGYGNAKNMYDEVFSQYYRYTTHVLNNIGGISRALKAVEEKGVSFQPIPKSIQQQSMAFLGKELFETPEWLMNPRLIEQTGQYPLSKILAVQRLAVKRLLNPKLVTRMINMETNLDSQTYTAAQMLKDLRNNIWTELSTGKPIDRSRRNLQKVYLDNLIILEMNKKEETLNLVDMFANMMDPGRTPLNEDTPNIVRMELVDLKKMIQKALPKRSGIERMHLQSSIKKIDDILDVNNKKTVSKNDGKMFLTDADLTHTEKKVSCCW